MGLARGSFGSTSGASLIFPTSPAFFVSVLAFFLGRRLKDRLCEVVMGVERGRKARAAACEQCSPSGGRALRLQEGTN